MILVLLVMGCGQQVDAGNDAEVNSELESKFDEDYRPDWWENIDNPEHIYSYEFSDGSDQETIKKEAIKSAQAKLLHYKKKYVVNLTAMILKESNSQDKFKSKSLNRKNDIIYNKDYSQYVKEAKIEFIPQEDGYRCFVALSLPLEPLNMEFVHQFQKSKSTAASFAKSETYRYLLKLAGLNIVKEEKKEAIPVKKDTKETTTPTISYAQDIVPAWFKVSYNNKKVMVNQSATAKTEEESIRQAVLQCNKIKQHIADNFARAEAEKYRKVSEYNEVKFAKLKQAISNEIMASNYPLSKEFVRTIQIGKDQYKTYAQYSLNKKTIQNTIINVLKTDEVLYSRLRASMAFDELEDQDF